ncbi:MAG: sterol desaturase family protein [Myxococcaceae bacterium]
MSFDAFFKRTLGDDEPTRLGTGWVSGVSSVFLGALGLAGVICFHFPALFTLPALRVHYPVPLLRIVLAVVLVAACALAVLSAMLRRGKRLAFVGAALSALAFALGGSSVALPDDVNSRFGLGLDWFALNALLTVVVFVPLERSRPLHGEQLVFRSGWTTDSVYFLVSHLLVQFFSFVALGIVARFEPFTAVGAAPVWAQVVIILVVADVAQYWTHRAFHRLSWLWRFHAIHHSSRELDWLAGSRLHWVDALVTRTCVLTPVLLLGFSSQAVALYLTFVSVHAVFIHANVALSLRWLEPVWVTPRYHNFHHASEREAIDRNFAVHLPWLDRLFGTQFFPPGRWPTNYGIDGLTLPEGYLAQLVWPFLPARRREFNKT